MKKALLATFIFITLFSSVHAQLPDLKSGISKATGLAGPGKLLSQFTNAIKPASFLSSWTGEKKGWLTKAGKITDAIGMAQSISSLAGFLKPSSFKSGFNVQNLLSTANTVKTMSDAAGLLKGLEGGLKPGSFVSGWSGQRSSWLNALNLLK